MTLMIGPLCYKHSGEQTTKHNPSNEVIVICNSRMEVLTEINPQQILGSIPTIEDRIEIARALVDAFNKVYYALKGKKGKDNLLQELQGTPS